MPRLPWPVTFGFLEAPRWREDRIWFSDFYTHRVLSAREDGSDLRTRRRASRRPTCRSPVYACALGGADGRTLYACAAPDFDEAARTAAQEATLIAFRVAVPGA